jgi:hypothetical protein
MGVTAGSRLGPYEVLSALGAGGMDEVYLPLFEAAYHRLSGDEEGER